jgi:hypothetical protein
VNGLLAQVATKIERDVGNVDNISRSLEDAFLKTGVQPCIAPCITSSLSEKSNDITIFIFKLQILSNLIFAEFRSILGNEHLPLIQSLKLQEKSV